MLANDRLGIAGLKCGIAHGAKFPDVHADECVPKDVVRELEVLAEFESQAPKAHRHDWEIVERVGL